MHALALRPYALSVAVLPLLLGACSAGHPAGEEEVSTSSAGSCVARLLVDGVDYVGMGGLKRDPEITGKELEAVMPGCADMGEKELPPDETVSVQVLDGIDPRTAFLFDDAIYIREARLQDPHLQERIRHWRTSPRCATAGTFELTGTWLGVTGPHKPEYDGDIRLPYRVTMHVDAGPRRYLRSQVRVSATTATSPALGTDDVLQTLWTGGRIAATVRCRADRFVAVSLRSRAS